MNIFTQVKQTVKNATKTSGVDLARASKAIGMNGLMLGAAATVVTANVTAKGASYVAENVNNYSLRLAKFVVAQAK